MSVVTGRPLHMPNEGESNTLGNGAQALWAKAAKGKRASATSWHSLPCHMTDSGEVGSWLWGQFLSPGIRERVEAAVPGDAPERGRRLLRWLAALHDFGKATPSFQVQHLTLAAAVRAAGLPIASNANSNALSHSGYSGHLLLDLLTHAGWDDAAASWVALTAASHHGVSPGANWTERQVPDGHKGVGPWEVARGQLLALVCSQAGAASPAELAMAAPGLPLQMVLAGAVALADWIASNEDVYPYAGELRDAYPQESSRRASMIPAILGLGDRWRPDRAVLGMSAGELLTRRFPEKIKHPRPVQLAACELACEGRGGLLLIEAPMGEGKTEGAFGAAEIAGAATGADGVFDALPSKATANQMLTRARGWVSPQSGLQVIAVAHGSAQQNEEYRELLASGVGIDEKGEGVTASQWLSGRKKALLAPVVVGTIDQLLLAGVSSKHVSLRHLGLAGKVVIIDEVHACDAYMSVILRRVLEWLGAARIPVIMLSATLAADQRRQLLAAYAGAETREDPLSAGYPRLSWVPAPDQITRRRGRADRAAPVEVRGRVVSTQRSASASVHLVEDHGGRTVSRKASELVADGGCALVVQNTVGRAQETYRELLASRSFARDELMLFHARFTAADRRLRETELVGLFGSDKKRPSRHVVCATQTAEQSIDCDWDVLLSDLAPIDLLFQRLGRIHRHRKPEGSLRELQMYVTGRKTVSGQPPEVPWGSKRVYSEHLLWRTEAVLTGRSELKIPEDIPRLVDMVYSGDPLGPPEWQPILKKARAEDDKMRSRMEEEARKILIPSLATADLDLSRIHSSANVGEADDESRPEVQAHTRFGPPTMEVVLLGITEDGSAVTLSHDGHNDIPLGRKPDPDETKQVLDQLIRLPAQLTKAIVEEEEEKEKTKPVPAWRGSPLVGRLPVLRLPYGGQRRIGGFLCSYSPELGLEVARA